MGNSAKHSGDVHVEDEVHCEACLEDKGVLPVSLLRCRFLWLGFWCWRCLLGAWLPCGPARVVRMQGVLGSVNVVQHAEHRCRRQWNHLGPSVAEPAACSA